jgi:cystathionine beta-synthase
VNSLRLKPITTVRSNFPCENAIEIMRDRGFDQLPVLAPSGKKLVGLATLGNILSRLTHGRATGKSPVSDVMFDFSRIPEVVTDPRDLGLTTGGELIRPETLTAQRKGRKFIEITMDTPLSVLNRFLEWNSAAIVTETNEQGTMRPVAVATKVDLLTWMLHHNENGS